MRRAFEVPGDGRRRFDLAGAEIEQMVACAHCGLHLPRAEALEHAHRHYCCAEHRSAGPR